VDWPRASALWSFCEFCKESAAEDCKPSEQAILNDTFPVEKRGMAFAVYGVAVVVAPTIGPWLGGMDHRQFFVAMDFLYQRSSWNNSLILTSLLVSDPPYMKRAKAKEGFRIDYIGIGLISLGLGSMQIILDKGEREDWFSSGFIQVFFVLMIIGIIAGILWSCEKSIRSGFADAERPELCGSDAGDVFSGVCTVRQHGVDPPVLAANDGLYGGTGGAGAVSGRCGDHVHDAGSGNFSIACKHEVSDRVRMHDIGVVAVRDGQLESAD